MTPLPGSKAATNRGCKCPVEENQRGKGVAHSHEIKNDGVYFCISQSCPMHGQNTWSPKA